MNLCRKIIDNSYLIAKHFIFEKTKDDPEVAHESLIRYSNLVHRLGLESFLFDNYSNQKNSDIKFSNAAGFNKDGNIPPTFLNKLGFDRVVVGTVAYGSWAGNPRPRIKRFPKSRSIVNWMGLPGAGAIEVAENLKKYENHNIPLTINLMATPGSAGKNLLYDLYRTVIIMRDVSFVDRFELNISCPNTHSSSGGMDARDEYSRPLEDMIRVVNESKFYWQDLFLKLSPDSSVKDIESLLKVCSPNLVQGFTVSNTTTNHNPYFIAESPGKGGASGMAVYDRSFVVQDILHTLAKNDYSIIACGGIDSVEKLDERVATGAEEIQLFTPLVFCGPKLLRTFRDHAFVNYSVKDFFVGGKYKNGLD